MRKRSLLAASIAPLLTLAAPIGHASSSTPIADTSVCGGPGSLEAAPADLRLEDLSGRSISLGELRGRVVVLDFWATWCAPCRVEIPEFVDLYDRYHPKGLEILGVTMDDDLDEVRTFADELNMNYPIVPGVGNEALEDAFDVFGLPTTIVLTRDGELCRRHVGPTDKEALEREISALLE